jgi:hypothetical protein
MRDKIKCIPKIKMNDVSLILVQTKDVIKSG